MGGLMSRNKGKRAEREVVKLLQPILTEEYERKGLEAPELERNLLQSHKGGYDIAGLDWMAPEVKHHETLAVNTWWDQTIRQALAKEREPILFYRQNNAKWKVRMNVVAMVDTMKIQLPADISLDHFLVWFRYRVRLEAHRESLKVGA
jgi:hypothetical protein